MGYFIKFFKAYNFSYWYKIIYISDYFYKHYYKDFEDLKLNCVNSL